MVTAAGRRAARLLSEMDIAAFRSTVVRAYWYYRKQGRGCFPEIVQAEMAGRIPSIDQWRDILKYARVLRDKRLRDPKTYKIRSVAQHEAVADAKKLQHEYETWLRAEGMKR